MININIVILIIVIHWMADFVFQTDWMAKNKSKSWKALLLHTGVYSLAWLPFSIITFGPNGWKFLVATFIAHTLTDYFTSRLNGKLWAENKIHYFFVSVGFDQILHYIQLLITYYLLIK